MASLWRIDGDADGWPRASPPQAFVAMVLVSTLIWVLSVTLKARWARSPPNQPKPTIDVSPKQPPIEPLHGFDWRSAEPIKFRAFKPVYHITMALQASPPSDLITMDKNYLQRVLIRRDLIQRHPDTVHGRLPEGDGAVRELYAFLLGTYLPTRFPTMFRLSGDGKTFDNLVTGKTYPAAPPEETMAALRALGETVEDDMFLLRETPEGHRAVAFICCFPSGFDPSRKFGNLLRDIHTPVPSYEKIGASMERVFSRLEVGKNVKRLNWSVQTHGELLNCEGNHITKEDADLSVDPNVDISTTYLRSELQTLSRLPETRALLFSFKTYMYPVAEIKEEGLGPEFADAIEGLKSGNAPGMWKYKSAVRWSQRVCEYLRS